MTAPRVTEEQIKSRIAETHYARLGGGTHTVCFIRLDNGYVVTGESACVHPENFDAKIGQDLAYQDAFKKLWPLFGFLLAEQLHHRRAQEEFLRDRNVEDRIKALEERLLQVGKPAWEHVATMTAPNPNVCQPSGGITVSGFPEFAGETLSERLRGCDDSDRVFTVKDVARITHEANRAACAARGDHSQEPWLDAPDWQKESAIQGVRFHLLNPDATPEQSHENWMAQKDRDGWTWGPKKDPEAKTHPCMVPYDLLPPEQRAKDHLFRGIVHALRPFTAPS